MSGNQDAAPTLRLSGSCADPSQSTHCPTDDNNTVVDIHPPRLGDKPDPVPVSKKERRCIAKDEDAKLTKCKRKLVAREAKVKRKGHSREGVSRDTKRLKVAKEVLADVLRTGRVPKLETQDPKAISKHNKRLGIALEELVCSIQDEEPRGYPAPTDVALPSPEHARDSHRPNLPFQPFTLIPAAQPPYRMPPAPQGNPPATPRDGAAVPPSASPGICSPSQAPPLMPMEDTSAGAPIDVPRPQVGQSAISAFGNITFHCQPGVINIFNVFNAGTSGTVYQFPIPQHVLPQTRA